MLISTDMDEVIEFLLLKKKEGYKTVELIDDGWEMRDNKNRPVLPIVFHSLDSLLL